jgi:hypothetical protein
LLLYSAFGLRIASEVPLQDLTPGVGAADVYVRLGDLHARVERLRQAGETFFSSPEETLLYWRDIGAFLARQGREVLVEPVAGYDPGEVQIALLGPVLAALLAQRGYLLLHASAVAIDGAGVVFLGSTGWGKSTLAAALQARGHPLVVDDLAAIDCSGDTPSVLPGFPHAKLWPDSLEALGEDPEGLPRIAEQYRKRRRALPTGFCESEAVPLQRLYVLAGGEAPSLSPLTAAEAFVQLTVHSYGIRWFLKEANAGQFKERGRIAQAVPALRLHRPADLARLPELVELVERDTRAGLLEVIRLSERGGPG